MPVDEMRTLIPSRYVRFFGGEKDSTDVIKQPPIGVDEPPPLPPPGPPVDKPVPPVVKGDE